jgi:hypothetical protein
MLRIDEAATGSLPQANAPWHADKHRPMLPGPSHQASMIQCEKCTAMPQPKINIKIQYNYYSSITGI